MILTSSNNIDVVDICIPSGADERSIFVQAVLLYTLTGANACITVVFEKHIKFKYAFGILRCAIVSLILNVEEFIIVNELSSF